jgi:sugar lactone lactonase YvrE
MAEQHRRMVSMLRTPDGQGGDRGAARSRVRGPRRSLLVLAVLLSWGLVGCFSGSGEGTPVKGGLPKQPCSTGYPPSDVRQHADTCGVMPLLIPKDPHDAKIPHEPRVGVVELDLYIEGDHTCGIGGDNGGALCAVDDNRPFVGPSSPDPHADPTRNRVHILIDFAAQTINVQISPSCRIHFVDLPLAGPTGLKPGKECFAPKNIGQGTDLSLTAPKPGMLQVKLNVLQTAYWVPEKVGQIENTFDLTPRGDGSLDFTARGTRFPDLALIRDGVVGCADRQNDIKKAILPAIGPNERQYACHLQPVTASCSAGQPPDDVRHGANTCISTIAGTGVMCPSPGPGVACAGGGLATQADFSGLDSPRGVAVDAKGNVYVADNGGDRVEKVSPNGTFVTVAGTGSECGVGSCGDGGPATAARIDDPEGVAIDGAGDLYIATSIDNKVRKVASDGTISTVAGTGTQCATPTSSCGDGGPATAAQLSDPRGIAVDGAGNLYIADTDANKIRKVTPGGTISTIAGDGLGCVDPSAPENSPISPCYGPSIVATAAPLNQPDGVAVDTHGNVYIADTFANRVRKVTPDGAISTIAGTGTGGGCDASGNTLACGDGGSVTDATLNLPSGVAADGHGDVYIADTWNSLVREVTADGAISTIAGSLALSNYTNKCPSSISGCGDGGSAARANLTTPYGIALDGYGTVYVADTYDHKVRKFQVSSGVAQSQPAALATPTQTASLPTTSTPTTSSQSSYSQCDPNVSVSRGECQFAENTFYEYWLDHGASTFSVYSPADGTAFTVVCSVGNEISCTASQGTIVHFSQTSISRYTQAQADTYSGSHSLGP